MPHHRLVARAASLAGIGLFVVLIVAPSLADQRVEKSFLVDSFAVDPFAVDPRESTSSRFPWIDEFIDSPEFLKIQQYVDTDEAAWLFGGVGILMLGIGLTSLIRNRPTDGVATLLIAFPPNVDGVFHVALRRPRASRSKGSSRRTRSGVQRETQFEHLRPGKWVACIDGTLTAPRSGALLGKVRQDVYFEVFADSVTPVEVELPKIQVHVELRVLWDRESARDVGVSSRGIPESLRYSGHGVSRISLDIGSHEVLIGAGDRVVTRTIDVENYEPMLMSVDLATSEGLIFKGCPPAVKPCLQGDLGAAARALDRDGQADMASLLLAELHQEQGQVEHAAVALEDAGKPLEAATLRRSFHDYRGAAILYEEAGSAREAAEMFIAAGSWSEAARVYESIEDWPRAAEAFEQAGDQNGLVSALDAQGDFLRAAGIAAEIDDRARAIRLLQKIAPLDANHGRASELLALAYEQEGHLDLAANQIQRRLEFMPPGESAPQLEFHLSELLEDIGDEERALSVLETLRDREPTYPQVATRIEGLRKKLSASHRQSATDPFSAAAGATAFVTQSRYEIIDEIGSGGMGRVYRALDRRLGREVSLKRLPDNLRDHPAAVALFLGEAQAAARMNHPNIVTLFDADQEQGNFFITMELLQGLPLNTVLKQHGVFDAGDTARLGLQACAGLTYAHAQGIVHRDIKTANFFITKDKSLKIMDFGLAKMVEAVRSKGATLIAGTPLYMAPEQAAGKVVDGRTDLYGLGVTLFELSTGRLPFFEGDVADQHRHAAPPDPATLVSDYPADLATLILRLLSKRPEDRPASAAWVASELSRILDANMTDGSILSGQSSGAVSE